MIATPYISAAGVDFVRSNLPQSMTESGRLVLLTDLSPVPICQGSTDPSAIRRLAEELPVVNMFHLPKLHAKVYVSGSKRALVTSGNLTKGGLDTNYEYGIRIDDPSLVAGIRNDVLDYSNLGARFSLQRLLEYCEIAEKVRDTFRDQLSVIAKAAHGGTDRGFGASFDREDGASRPA
jgi:PLD-like domain